VPSRGLCVTGAQVTRQKALRRRHPTRLTAPPPPPISPPPRLPLAPPLRSLPADLLLWRRRRQRARTKRGDRIRLAALGTFGLRDDRAVVMAARARLDAKCAGRRADGTDARRCVACWYDHEYACVYADAEREARRNQRRFGTYPRRLLHIPSAASPAAPTASAAALRRIGAAHSASPAFDAASSVGGVPTKDILLHEVRLSRKPRVYLNVGR
jgi:hypothetical protein